MGCPTLGKRSPGRTVGRASYTMRWTLTIRLIPSYSPNILYNNIIMPLKSTSHSSIPLHPFLGMRILTINLLGTIQQNTTPIARLWESETLLATNYLNGKDRSMIYVKHKIIQSPSIDHLTYRSSSFHIPLLWRTPVTAKGKTCFTKTPIIHSFGVVLLTLRYDISPPLNILF